MFNTKINHYFQSHKYYIYTHTYIYKIVSKKYDFLKILYNIYEAWVGAIILYTELLLLKKKK